MSKWGLAILAGAAACMVLFFAVDPESAPFMPRCPFKWLTGYDCPACGVQRALHRLLHLRFGEAFACNPFLVVSMPYLLALVACKCFDGSGRMAALERFCHHHRTVGVYLLLMTAWWVLRNVA